MLNPTGANNNQAMQPILSAGGPGNYNFGNTTNPTTPQAPTNTNPFYPTAGAPSPTGVPPSNSTFPGASAPPSMNPGAPGGTPGTVTLTDNNGKPLTTTNTFNQNPTQQNWSLNELQNQYGTGIGSMIFQYLQSGAGYNAPLAQQSVDATNKAMEQNINLGYGNLQSTLSGSGISADSSSSALELSNYLSNAYTQMNAIDASIYEQMWSQASSQESQLLSDVGKEGATHTANQPTFLSVLGQLSSDAGSVMAGMGGI